MRVMILTNQVQIRVMVLTNQVQIRVMVLTNQVQIRVMVRRIKKLYSTDSVLILLVV
jgi:hypothetical protein